MRGCMASRHHGMTEQLSACGTSRRRLQRSRAATGWIATTLLTFLALIDIPQATAQTQQQICTWDGKVCNLMINFAVQASRSSQKVIDLLPKDPYIIGGQFIWGCSLNDYQGCLQDAKQGDNTRHCKWDDKASLCIIDPMYTQSVIVDRYLCNKTQIGQFLGCSFMQKNYTCNFRKGCSVDDTTLPPTGSEVACVPDFWLTMPNFKRVAFMQQVNNLRSDLYDDCPLAKVAYQYRQACFEAEDSLGCKSSSICTWNKDYGRCFPSDMAMSVLIWGGDRDDAQTGVTSTNMCRAASDKTSCLSVKSAVPKKPALSLRPIRYDAESSAGKVNTDNNPNWGSQVYFPTFTGIGSSNSAAANGTEAAAGAGGVTKAAQLRATDPNMQVNSTMPMGKGTANFSGLSSSFGNFAYQNNGAAAVGNVALIVVVAAMAAAMQLAFSMM